MIDFDATIHSYHNGWSNGVIYGYPIEGSVESITELKNKGYEIVIFTARLAKQTELHKLKIEASCKHN